MRKIDMDKQRKDSGQMKRSITLILAIGVILSTGACATTTGSSVPETGIRADTLAATNPEAGAYVATAEETKDVVCNIGSVSKTFVTVAALQLADAGKIDLDEPVITYIPEFTMDDERYKDITVRMLMNHSSGLMGTTFGDSFLFEDNDLVSHDLLLENLSGQKLKADPGEFSVYCNDGFWLLELLVERVSGETFTEYLQNHIEKPLGLTQTGTPVDMFQTPEAIDIFTSGGDRIGHEYVMDIGSGGIISTASELSIYGSTFWEGDNTLLSDEAKEQMTTNYAKDEYESPYGLGWDSVEVKPFSDAGVLILEKGGATSQQFADLMVAPGENISIAVLSSGANPLGSSAMARALMKIALEEGGITVSDPLSGDIPTKNSVPEELKQYEGVYTTNSALFKVEFPNMEYMTVTSCDTDIPKTTYYKCTEDNGFVLMSGGIEASVQDASQTVYHFAERENGRTYIVRDAAIEYVDFGIYYQKDYFAEKLEPNKVTPALTDAWKTYEGEYSLYSGKYSNMNFTLTPKVEMKVSEAMPGYVILEGSQVLKIIDETHAEPFLQIPCQNGRDLTSIVIEKQDDRLLVRAVYSDAVYIKDSCLADFSEEIRDVTTTRDEAIWYNLTDETKGRTVTFERSENTSIYVYDKYGTLVYSTYMMDYPNEVALPTEGKIAFVGDDGEKIALSFPKK